MSLLDVAMKIENSSKDREAVNAIIKELSLEELQAIVKCFQLSLAHKQSDSVRKCLCILRHLLVAQPQSHSVLASLTEEDLQGLAEYIPGCDSFSYVIDLIDMMFIDHKQPIYAKSIGLFKALVHSFSFCTVPDERLILMENLVEMMHQNKMLIPQANNPYHFLQFWLMVINAEESKERAMHWFRCIKDFYSTLEDCLFYANDFYVVVDVLVRHIENHQEEEELREYLETYLILSLSKHMSQGTKKDRYYRLSDICIVLGEFKCETDKMADLVQEINNLS